MIFFLSFLLSFQIVPISQALNILGTDFVVLLPDSETDVFFNPANIFLWDRTFLYSFSTFHNYLYLNTEILEDKMPISFQNLLSIRGTKKSCSYNIAYQYLLSYIKIDKKCIFLNFHNLPLSMGYDLGKIKVGLGLSYQQFYLKKTDTLGKKFVKKEEYLPIRLGLSTGEEDRLEFFIHFTSTSNTFRNCQLNLVTKKILSEIEEHIFLLETNYRREEIKDGWEFIVGYCLSSRYNFYGFVFNNFLAIKPSLSLEKEKVATIKIIFPYGFICSLGRIKFLFGLRNGIIWNRENAYFIDYEYNLGINYRFLNNFEFYFSNLQINSSRKWFLGFKFFF